jgi:hypothetical protein
MEKSRFEKTGKLIDAWIRLQRMINKYPKSITEYINIELAEECDLSGRQIERMRRYDGFPEDKAILKLINAIPDLESLNCSNFTERLLLPFPVVAREQDRIKPAPKERPNTMTLISGWKQPLGIEQIEIAEATAKNVSAGFEYIFLYPDPQTYPEKDIQKGDSVDTYAEAVERKTEEWVDILRGKCEGRMYTQLFDEYTDRSEAERKFNKFKGLTKQQITRQHSRVIDSKFWFLLPSNYVVLYNADKPKNSGFTRYGVFQIEGKLIKHSPQTLEKEDITSFINKSSGWLYIEDNLFEELASLYQEICKGKS